jgi:hypothetical protein
LDIDIKEADEWISIVYESKEISLEAIKVYLNETTDIHSLEHSVSGSKS